MINLPTEIKITEESPAKATIVIEGLYPGYGITLGNALRRVLLSSLAGAAITSFKIKGIEHEFSTIPHVLESVIDIMLNLKKIRLRLYGEEPQKLVLRAKGEGEIKAKDISLNPMVKIINPESHIATITDKKGELEIEMKVEHGLGYSPAEERKQEKLPIGTILMDAIFSPIQKVNFRVENMRVGKRVDYNRLILEIETDGAKSPVEVFDEAVSILKNHYDYLSSWSQKMINPPVVKVEKGEKAKEKTTAVSKEAKIEELDFSNRTKNALIKNSVKTLAGLLRFSEEGLKGLEGLGDKSIEEIKEKLSQWGYSLKS